MFANQHVEEGESADQSRTEEERGGNLSHSFIPLFVHRNAPAPIWFHSQLILLYVHVMFPVNPDTKG